MRAGRGAPGPGRFRATAVPAALAADSGEDLLQAALERLLQNWRRVDTALL